jgi:hypothetical protein
MTQLLRIPHSNRQPEGEISHQLVLALKEPQGSPLINSPSLIAIYATLSFAIFKSEDWNFEKKNSYHYIKTGIEEKRAACHEMVIGVTISARNATRCELISAAKGPSWQDVCNLITLCRLVLANGINSYSLTSFPYTSAIHHLPPLLLKRTI